MRITVACVGRLAERHFRDAANEYLKRLRPYANVAVAEVPDEDLTGGEQRARAAEAAALLRRIPEHAHVIVLDIDGEERSSEAFARRLGELAHAGVPSIVFVIGGASGLDGSILERADERLSLGPMTLPHQLARVVLLEQIYRAFRILRGEPYHR